MAFPHPGSSEVRGGSSPEEARGTRTRWGLEPRDPANHSARLAGGGCSRPGRQGRRRLSPGGDPAPCTIGGGRPSPKKVLRGVALAGEEPGAPRLHSRFFKGL